MLLLCFQMVLQMTVQKTVLVQERVRQMKKGLKPVAMPKIDRKSGAFSPKLPQISCERGYSSIYLWVYRISFQGEDAVIRLMFLESLLQVTLLPVNDLGHIPNTFVNETNLDMRQFSVPWKKNSHEIFFLFTNTNPQNTFQFWNFQLK